MEVAIARDAQQEHEHEQEYAHGPTPIAALEVRRRTDGCMDERIESIERIVT